MKSVLLSIQSKWCELIASGKKTIEVRKTAPKLETPFKCYIYETKAKGKQSYYNVYHEKTIGKVIGEFVCKKIEEWNTTWLYGDDALQRESCLDDVEIMDYMNDYTDRIFYLWHISDLKIYDTPKKLSEFRKPCPFPSEDCEELCKYAELRIHTAGNDELIEIVGCHNRVSRPPQSWCYVEEL